MNKPVLTIGLSDEVNAAFEKYIALDQVSLVVCKDISEAMVLITKMPFRLIIYNAAALGYDEVQDMVCRVRRIVYTPMVVLCIDEAAAATQEVGADICAADLFQNSSECVLNFFLAQDRRLAFNVLVILRVAIPNVVAFCIGVIMPDLMKE